MARRPTAARDPERNARLVDYLARERWAWLCAVARRSGIESHAVDDVVQSALLDVLRSFPGPDEPRNVVAAYAARCVQTEAWKLHRRLARKEGRLAPLPERARGDRGTTEEVNIADPSAPDVLEVVIASEASREAQAVLEALPQDQRATLLLRAAGFGPAEIAQRLNLSPRGVRKRIEKANRRLRQLNQGAP
jgi:RNA polymerase sigma factor (sigma-70 family)